MLSPRLSTALRYASLVALALLAAPVVAQESPLTEPPNGPRRIDPGWHALVGATVHPEPGGVIEGATIVVRGGRIVSVGFAPPPAGARVWNLAGLHVYPAFIDAWVEVDAPRPGKGAAGEHWCPLVTPRRSALDGPGIDAKTAKQLRELGFAAAAIAPRGGVFRGEAALVSLAEPDPEPGADPPPVYSPRAYHTVAFESKGGDGGAPNSEMGAIALVRQVLMDAVWIAAKGVGGAKTSLDVLVGPEVTTPPLLFDTGHELTALRAAKVAAEFERRAILLGSGLEFRRLEAVRRAGVPVVVPLRFAEKPDVASIGGAEGADLRTLMTWEQGPTNPARLAKAGVLTALTTGKIEKRDKFPDHLRKAIRHGLTEERALAMLTTNAAKILSVADRMGRVAPGLVANLQVTDGAPFGKKTRLLWLWVDGKAHEMKAPSLEGTWEVEIAGEMPHTLTLLFDAEDKLTVRVGDVESRGKEVAVVGNRVSVTFVSEAHGEAGAWVLSGVRDGDEISGRGRMPGGVDFGFRADRTSREGPAKKGDEDEGPAEYPESYGLPFGPYAIDGTPEQPEVVVVTGATIWTCGHQGVIEDGVMVVRKGRVEWVGPRERAPKVDGAFVIDAEGKHVTPGIIDCHSHTGISGNVNESNQAVTAEVRIQDVTDPDDVNWYRQLAGGVTAVMSLHGSANPIGGQSQTVKLRWGAVHPDEMHFEGAAPGIKFALGENVKQSNWGDDQTTRYPQTRMGVETLIRDRFAAAREYSASWLEWGYIGKKGAPPRRDLELEALAEVLAGERLLHCHSYRQDEILMLCRVADFGFKIGTFQHVLEGYKVAEAIKEHALGASCFSDWWAYKVEVQDAIPENGAIMHEVGVCVSFNSNSSELARRLNVEAAKALKYGGLTPEDALKLVTLYPARQMKIDERVGSLEAGKDADFAVWSKDPLSTTAVCERTWIDGREYFSLESDLAHRERIEAERERLIQKALAAKDKKKWWEEEEEEDYECCDKGGGR